MSIKGKTWCTPYTIIERCVIPKRKEKESFISQKSDMWEGDIIVKEFIFSIISLFAMDLKPWADQSISVTTGVKEDAWLRRACWLFFTR